MRLGSCSTGPTQGGTGRWPLGGARSTGQVVEEDFDDIFIRPERSPLSIVVEVDEEASTPFSPFAVSEFEAFMGDTEQLEMLAECDPGAKHTEVSPMKPRKLDLQNPE